MLGVVMRHAGPNGSVRTWRDYMEPRRVSFYYEVADLLPNLSGKAVLEVGAFFGVMLRILHARWPKADYHGIECAEQVRMVAEELCPFAMIRQGTLEDVHAEYDVVLLMEVLEHLANPEVALRQLFAITRETLVVTVPNGRYDTMGASQYKPERKSYLGHVNFNFWSPESWLHWLRSQAESSGMTLRTGVLPTGQLYAVIQR